MTRDNHYVSRFYLKRWSSDGKKIWCYRTLVPNAKVPVWSYHSIKTSAYVTDLYTSVLQGQLHDDYELWIKKEYEDPALNSICSLEAGKNLSDEDTRSLVRFLALQDVRTPQNYLETLSRWKKNLPEVDDQVLERIIKQLQDGTIKCQPPHIKEARFARAFKTEALPALRNGIHGIEFKIRATFDREAWIDEQKHLLGNTAKRLFAHSWWILEAAPNISWYTSDHPVVRLNYYGQGSWDLRGGWARNKGNVFMPLTPKYLLFTQIGDFTSTERVLSREKTLEMNDIILQRAFRSIFSVRKMNRVCTVRPRLIDAELLAAERQFWERWRIDEKQVPMTPIDST